MEIRDSGESNNNTGERMVRLSWAGGGPAHSALISDTVTRHLSLAPDTADLVLLVQGSSIPVHRSVLAAASPYLASLVRDTAETSDTLSLVEISHAQALLVVQFMYRGVLERLSEPEIDQLLEAVSHLEITGMRPGDKQASVKLEAMETESPQDDNIDDDVFSDQAVDLSPVNRHPPTPLLSGNLDLASRRMASLSKISQALMRNSESSGSSKSSGSGSGDSRARSSGSEYRSASSGRYDNHGGERFLNRIKKPKPLTNLPKFSDSDTGHSSGTIYLKPKTPRTPLLVSPDCHALEERFRNLIETNAADTEKLRNLSVSSADFNFEVGGSGGGSLPNTPLRTPRSFHFPPSTLASGSSLPAPVASGSLDLSLKKVSGSETSEDEANSKLPTINVIKPEPEDPGEAAVTFQRGRSPPSSFPFVTVTKSSPVYQADSPLSSPHCPDSPSPVTSGDGPSVKTEQTPTPSIFFPQFPLPLNFSPANISPSAFLSPGSPGPGPPTLDPAAYRALLNSGAFLNSNNDGKKFSTGGKKDSVTLSGNSKKQQQTDPHTSSSSSNSSSGPKQSFKCQKCGKCYNWNYNLNRHMRFECGIENRFECSMCHKRFPYKQNVAIHLKRKHKLQLDNADDMIAQGHITLLPGAKNDDNS